MNQCQACGEVYGTNRGCLACLRAPKPHAVGGNPPKRFGFTMLISVSLFAFFLGIATGILMGQP